MMPKVIEERIAPIVQSVTTPPSPAAQWVATPMEEFEPDAMYVPPVYKQEKQRLKLNPQQAFVRTAKIFAPAGFGLILIFFGLTSTGSYYAQASRFGGFLAEVFYGWQLGNLMAMVGVVLIYDAVKRAGYL